jgi:CHASE1-domain containing sensor protein
MQKETQIKQRVTIPASRYLPVLCILVFGIVVSFLIFHLVYNWEQVKQRGEFESRANAYTNAIEHSLIDSIKALQFLGDFFNNSQSVTRQEFNSLSRDLLPRYPGIHAFGWDPLVKDAERSFYEAAARKDGYNDFEFKERSETEKLVKAAHREEYVIVFYIYPLESNRSALGFDIASNNIRLRAITKGFNSGNLTATDRITLVQETGSQFGVLILLPIYHQGVPLNSLQDRRNSRKGFVVEVLRIGEAVESALKGFADNEISLALYDMSADKENRLLYHRSSRVSETKDQPIPAEGLEKGLLWSKTFDFADRQWEVLLRPSDFYYQTWYTWSVLFGSLLLTALWAFYMLRKIRYTAEIEQRVKRQAQTNQQLEKEISVRSAAEAERDNTIMNLQRALEEVENLRGILPICSYCKKVRDDKGYWEQVDVYISKHSQADISHGICPECAKKHYPEIYIDLRLDQE